jgi:23S rRNA pseudouridine1911/1915/1917 synthase
LTGRTHQIRVHLMAIGHTVMGDELYGSSRFGRLMLHAWQLKLSHPVTGVRLEILAPLPTEFASLDASQSDRDIITQSNV